MHGQKAIHEGGCPESHQMKLKLDANGNAVLQDGKPVYILDDGREVAHDAAATVAKISSLNGEAMSHRQAKEAAEAALKPFKDAGIEDAAAAAAALQTMANINSGDLTTAAKVQEIKDAATRSANEAVAAATRAAEEKQRTLTEQNTKLTNDLNDHIIGGSFASSKFISEKLAIPADMARTFFGSRFKVDGGKLVPMDQQGNPIFSSTNHGNHADFDEAIQVMVGQYANKDMILKGSGASGGGAGGGKAGSGGGKEIPRSQFFTMPPQAQADAIKGGAVVTD